MSSSPRQPLVAPEFFASPADFRQWLGVNAATATELLVGFRKVGSGLASLSWSESVDEALCFGWIDGVRKRIDEQSYSIRFTPRRAGSIWSAINMAKFEQLQSEGRMTAAGVAAYARRLAHKSAIYSYEQSETAELSAAELREFKRNRQAWKFFEDAPPGYKKQMLHRITAAKKAETRAARFAKLLEASAAGLRLP